MGGEGRPFAAAPFGPLTCCLAQLGEGGPDHNTTHGTEKERLLALIAMRYVSRGTDIVGGPGIGLCGDSGFRKWRGGHQRRSRSAGWDFRVNALWVPCVQASARICVASGVGVGGADMLGPGPPRL